MVAPFEMEDRFDQVLARYKGRLLLIARQYASTNEVWEFWGANTIELLLVSRI
jgi:hypothetical protein